MRQEILMENKVFKINSEGNESFFPPEQIFDKKNFEFLLTMGCYLADNETEYQKLMSFLRSLGETEIFIVQNIELDWVKESERFVSKLPIESTLNSYIELGNIFDLNFGWIISNFFAYGKNADWGIYLCEYPTINIIGCSKQYVQNFKEIYGIKGNGFEELDEFISQEYQSRPHLKEQLIENYKLNR